MGKSKEIVKKVLGAPTVQGKEVIVDATSLKAVIDKIDSAIQAKQKDVQDEGHSKLAENQYKVGILQAAHSLLLRACFLLEDHYDSMLEVDEVSDGEEEGEEEEEEEEEEDFHLHEGMTVCMASDQSKWKILCFEGGYDDDPFDIELECLKNPKIKAIYENYGDFLADFEFIEAEEDDDEGDELCPSH